MNRANDVGRLRVHPDGFCASCPARAHCVFAELEGEELRRRVHEVSYAKRKTILREGDPAFGLYVIYRGVVKLYRHTLSGRRQILQLLGPADFFGEECLGAPDARYLSSVEALTATELLFITRQDLQVLLSHQGVAQRLIERLLDRQRRMEELLLEVHYSSAEERLGRLLLRLAHEHGHPLDGKLLIDLELTQAELGEMIGLTREAVNKHLSALKDQGLIAFRERKLYVDPLALSQALQACTSSS